MASIGVAAYMLTDLFHEVVGHGGTCVIIGQQVDLITSVYFKSSPGSFLTDIGGPVSNLLFGLLIHFFLKTRKNLSPLFTFFLLNLMAYNLCWFSGTLLQSGFSKNGDWTYAIALLNITALAKPVLIVAGIAAYVVSVKIIQLQFNRVNVAFVEFPLKQGVIYAYFAAAMAATIAGLFFKYDSVRAALEGLLEALGLLPILFIVPGKQNRTGNYEIGANQTVTVSVFMLFIVFCLTFGRGII